MVIQNSSIFGTMNGKLNESQSVSKYLLCVYMPDKVLGAGDTVMKKIDKIHFRSELTF